MDFDIDWQCFSLFRLKEGIRVPPTISLSALVLGQEIEKITPFGAHVTVVHQCLITVTFANIEKQTYSTHFAGERRVMTAM